LLFTAIVFIPIERFLERKDQPIFRYEWREDLLYTLISSLFVQVLAFLSMAPSLAILEHTEWGGFRHWVGGQPVLLQFLEIMVLTGPSPKRGANGLVKNYAIQGGKI